MKTRTIIALAGLCMLMLALSPAWAKGPVATTGQAIHHDTSPPLRDMAIPAAPFTGLSKEVPIMQKPDFGKDPDLAEPDGGLQSDYAPSFGPTPGVSLSAPGLSEQDNRDTVGFSVVPPDINGDIGLDAFGNRLYIQYINSIWGVFNDNGALIHGPFAGNSFWAGFGGPCETNNDGDPVVLYDDGAGRWFFSQFSINEGIQCVAVSTTSDPLGPYHRYAFEVTPDGSNDYPKLGVWDDGTTGSAGQSAYTFTLRDFGGDGGSFSLSAGVMERDAMLNGGAAQFVKFSNPCNSADCVEGQLPPHLAGPPPPAGTCPTYWAAADSAFDDSPYAIDGYRNHTLCVDWANVGNSTYREGPLVVAGSNFDRRLGNGFGGCISPVHGGENLDCLAIFTMYRAQYRWFGTEAAVVLNTTVDAGGDRAGIRWAETLSSTGDSNWTLGQDGTYAPADGLERWMGSIAQDQDRNIALGYSVAGSSLFPSVAYTSRMAGDAAGLMPGGEVTCHAGTGAQTASSGRWGDYSSMSVDPTDDCTFWYTQEYYQTTGSFDFKTRICSFAFPDCGGGQACGNDVIEGTEVCDGTNLGGQTCGDFGCSGGTLACNATCDGFDTSGCTGCPVCDSDGVCEAGENCLSCPSDCISGTIPGASCGNGLCEAGDGEDCVSCPADCNGVQTGKPANRFCCGDGDGQNPVGCGDSSCTTGGFDCTEAPVGGGGTYCCGDETCEGAEDNLSCELDCGPPPCGDGFCDPANEDQCSCSADCGSPPANEVPTVTCEDGIDNDCDQAVDCNDVDCDGIDPACIIICLPKNASCSIDSECCSGDCKGNGRCR